MADDALGLLDKLGVKKVALVGWSDGAIIGLDIAMRHPERLSRLFAFAANYDPSGVADIASSPVLTAYMERAGKEYEKLSPTPKGYAEFRASIEKMWDTQPNYSKDQLRAIGTPTWIVDGDHDEAIKRPHTEEMAALIPGAGLLIQPRVSHFSFLQNPAGFTADVERFLLEKEQ
jgi:pimeloyl-ACP methyl ester carboxylesterase